MPVSLFVSAPTPRFRLGLGNRPTMTISQNSIGNRPYFPSCPKYGRDHLGDCSVDQRGYFDYCKLGHRLWDYPYVIQGNRDIHPQVQTASAPAPLAHPVLPQGASSSTAGGQFHNYFYAIPPHQE